MSLAGLGELMRAYESRLREMGVSRTKAHEMRQTMLAGMAARLPMVSRGSKKRIIQSALASCENQTQRWSNKL